MSTALRRCCAGIMAVSGQRFVSLLSRRITRLSSSSVRHHNFDGEAYSKTNLAMITREDESHNYIQAYTTYGFRLTSGFSVLGPCAIFPRAILHWNVPSAEKITPESLSLFCVLEPKLDILVIGKGEPHAKVDNSIIKFLRSKKINVEILPTEQACSTFNFLNSERRVVAGALIPPRNIPIMDDRIAPGVMDEIEEMGEIKEAGDFSYPEVEKVLESFRDQGISETVKKYGVGKLGRKGGPGNPAEGQPGRGEDSDTPRDKR